MTTPPSKGFPSEGSPSHGGAGPTDPSDLFVKGSDRVAQARKHYEVTAEGIVQLVKQAVGEDRVRDEFWIMLRSMTEGCFQIGQGAGEASEGTLQMEEHLIGVREQMALHAKQTELHAKQTRFLEEQNGIMSRIADSLERIEKKLSSTRVVTDEQEE